MEMAKDLLLRSQHLRQPDQPEWLARAFAEFDQIVSQRDFPCSLGLAGHKKDLVRFGWIEPPRHDGKRLAAILGGYLTDLEPLPARDAGLAALVVFVRLPEAASLQDSHNQAWALLNGAMAHDTSPWPDGVGRDWADPNFVFCHGGEQWFVNVSAPAHVQRRSRHLGSALVLAMQPLSTSNGYFADTADKIASQRSIRDRTLRYDGMPVYHGLGPLIGEAEPRPLLESYFLPDDNADPVPTFQGGRFSHVLFDFDGTLADTAACGIEATQWAFADAGLNTPSEADIIFHMGVPIEVSFRQMSATPLDDEAFDALLRSFRRKYAEVAETKIRAFDGIVALLDELRARGVRTAIVTSKRTEVAHRNAAQIGIAHLIDVIVGPEMVENCKPAPDSVHAALTALGSVERPAEQVLVVGDSSYDIEMGKAAGVRTCAVTWGAHTHADLEKIAPDFVIHCVGELARLLRPAAEKCPRTGCPT